MPAMDYYDDHPEYFSILSNRKRTWEFGQYCLANPEVAKIMAQKTIEWMDREPEASIFSVSQNDWHVACDCPPCRKIDEAEESHAATLIYFVNAVAERTEKVHPEKRIGTLAYTYTEVPPLKARPRHNVIIRFAQIRGCDGHPLTNCAQNVKYRNYIRDWGTMADKVYIWDYVTNYAHYVQPHPILYSIYKDIQFFHEVGIDGVYPEANYQSEGAGFEDLQAWVEAKILWDPTLDLDELIADFMHGFYGPAAEPMSKYYYLLQNKTLDEWIHYRLYSPPTFGLFTPEVIEETDKLFAEAEELSKNDAKAAYRVAEAKLGMRYVKLSLPVRHVVEGDWLKVASNAPEYANLNELEKFMEAVDKHEITYLSEGRGKLARYDIMRANVTDHRIITLENPDIKIKVIPSLGGRIFKILHKKTGKNVLAMGSPDGYGYPASGGYQESPLNAEICDYILEEGPSGTKIIMDAYVRYRAMTNAFHYTREISIPSRGAKIDITSTMEALREVSRPMSIRPNPSFTIGPAWKVKAGWADINGLFDLQPLPEPNTPSGFVQDIRIQKEFWSNTLKTGTWAIYNSADKLGIINKFNLDEMDVSTLGANNENQTVTMSLRTKQKPMKEGDIISLHHSYEIVEEIRTQ